MFKNIPPEMLSMAQALERAISRDSELEIDSIQNKARWLKLIKEQNETIATLRAENTLLKQATRCHEHVENNHTRHCTVCGVPLAHGAGDEPVSYERLRQELDEAREAYRQLTKQADAFHSENARLREQLRKARITTVARVYNGEPLDCEGDGSGPGCEHAALWEIQAMDASGSHYSYVCSEHLNDYQKWANDDGRSPMVFELED